MTDVASRLFYNGVSTCCGFQIYAYSGAVKDTMNGRILFWGGGHADYSGNELYQFNLDSLNWERVTDPFINAEAECFDFTNVHKFTDNTPKARHTYDQMTYIYHQNKFWAHGGSICGAGSGIADEWTFDPITKTWTDLNPSLVYSWSPNLGLSCEYDPVTKLIYYFERSAVKTYDPDNDIWTTLPVSFNHSIERASVIHPRLRKIVTHAGSFPNTNKVSVFDIDSQIVKYPIVPAAVPVRSGVGWAFDSKNELFMAYGGYPYDGREVWYYNVETNVWFSELIPNGPNGNQLHYERFVYDDVNHVTYFFRSPYQDVWVLKNQNPGTTIGISKIIEKDIKITTYPNPFSFFVNIQVSSLSTTNQLKSVEIYNAQGKKVKTVNPLGSEINIQWNGYTDSGQPAENGIYTIRAINDNGIAVNKRLVLIK